MKKIKIFLLLTFLIGLQKNYCQNKIFVLNEIVGDTISLKEKKTYYLFEKISEYDTGCLIKKDNNFVLKYSFDNEKHMKIYDSLKIEEYKNNVIKIHEYLKIQSNTTKKDEKNILLIKNNNFKTSALYISEKGKKQMTKEAERVETITNSLDYQHDMNYQQKNYYKTLGGGGSINLKK